MDSTELLSDVTAGHIARLIEDGTYGPGCQLPPERGLAAQMRVSRTAVREAFRALQAIGLVEAHVGRGRFVTADAPDKRGHHLANQLFGLHQSELTELSEVRELLEVAAVRHIPTGAVPVVAHESRGVLEESRRALATMDLSRVAQLDSDLHVIPVKHCSNRPLRVLATGVIATMSEPVRAVLSDAQWAYQSLTEHERIVRAFDQGDVELAAVLIGHHQTAAARRRRLAEAIHGEPAESGAVP